MSLALRPTPAGYTLPSGFNGPIYAAVNPPTSVSLAPVQMPAQTSVSGAPATSWTWQAFDAQLQEVTAFFDNPTLTQPTLDLQAAVAAGGWRNGGPWLAVGTPNNGAAGPPVVLRWVVSDGWPWTPTTLHLLRADAIGYLPSVFGESGTLV